MKSKYILLSTKERKKMPKKLSTRKKRTTVEQDNEAERKESEKNGGFFKCAYNLYYMLDMPAADAFKLFCEVTRVTDTDRAAMYLYRSGFQDKSHIDRAYKTAKYDWRDSLQSKYDYIGEMVASIIERR